MLGGLVFTDNKARELLTRVSMSAGHTAIIYLPAFQIRKSTFPKEEIQEMAAEVTDAYNRALTGDVFGAMYENGR